jgi:hypothetical protein
MAGGHAGLDVACVAGVLEEVRVDVERDRDAGVAEDAADLGWVEPEVDDQGWRRCGAGRASVGVTRDRDLLLLRVREQERAEVA